MSDNKVKLVSCTAPISAGENLTAEELIAYCARVSNPNNQNNKETAPRLLKFCIKHGHWSIFEQADFCVEITTSRAIAAQLLRHKSFSFQEFSQRYSPAQSFEPIELRKQGETNRQGGEELIDPDILDPIEEVQGAASSVIESYLQEGKKIYNQLLEKGVAKESARMMLPLATTTRLYMKGSVRSWIHYLQLRTAQDTQKEHREIAEEIKAIFVKEFPDTSEALGWSV